MDRTFRVRSLVWLSTGVVLTLLCTLLVTQAWSAGADPGDDDTTFVPTEGCRLTDTRPATNIGPRNVPLGPNSTFDVTVHGSNGQCTDSLAIPTEAVGVVVNATVVDATAASNVRVYPADLPSVPLLSSINVTPGGPPTPNMLDVKLSADGTIRVYNFRGNVNIILDVVGYFITSSLTQLDTRLDALEANVYTKAEVDALLAAKLDDAKVMWAIVASDGALTLGKGAVAADTNKLSGTGAYEVGFNRNITGTCVATAVPADNSEFFIPVGEAKLVARNDEPSRVFVELRNSDGTSVDSPFSVIVICP